MYAIEEVFSKNEGESAKSKLILSQKNCIMTQQGIDKSCL